MFVNFQRIAEKNSISLYKRIFNIPLSFFFFFSSLPLNVNFQRNPREVLKNIGEQLGIFRCIGTFLWEGIGIDGGGTRSNRERVSRISRNWIEVKTTLQFVQAWAVLNSSSRLEEGLKNPTPCYRLLNIHEPGNLSPLKQCHNLEGWLEKEDIDFHLELEQKRKSSFPSTRQGRHLFSSKGNTFSAQIFGPTSSKDNDSLQSDEKLRKEKTRDLKRNRKSIEGLKILLNFIQKEGR